MASVVTSSSAQATFSGNQRKIDRCQNGVLWTLSARTLGVASTFGLSYSTDGGSTWSSPVALASIADGTNYTPNASMAIDLDDFLHVAYKDPNDGSLRYLRGTPNAARTAYTWSGATIVNGNAALDYPDLVAHREGNGWRAHVIAAGAPGNAQAVRYSMVTIDSAGNISAPASPTTISTSLATIAGQFPSLDFRHTGDGKTVASGTPDLFVGWSAPAAGAGQGIRFRKATYASGSWTWGTEREIDNTHAQFFAGNWLNCAFDGARVVISAYVPTSSSGGAAHDLLIHDRDAADTTTTSRTLLVGTGSGASALLGGGSTYTASGDLVVFGRGNNAAAGANTLAYQVWSRSAGSLGARQAIDTTASDLPFLSARRGPSGGAIDYVYTDGTASPYTVTSGHIVLNTAPTAATPTTPAAGSGVDRTQPITLAWVFNDPDAGDSQSNSDIRYKLTSASTWTTILGATTTATSYSLPANQAAGDYEWQVMPSDSQGVAAPWSASSFFTAANPPGTPVITAPANGGTIATASYTVTWSSPQQDAYEVRRVADNAGSPDPGTSYFTTGVIEDSTSRARTLAFDVNNRVEHVQVRVRYSGIWSTWASVRALVSYTRPPTPVAVLTPDNALAAMNIAITNPAPSGSQPAVSGNQIYVDNGDGLGSILLVDGQAANSTYSYRLAVPFLDYAENRVRVVAVGANGTTAEAFAT